MTRTGFNPLLLLLIQYVSSLIVPEEIPTILGVIYSEIPPIKKGTDSRLGVGFRFGEHADFQIILELGPQNETTPLKHPLSKEESKMKREAIMHSALKGELGPWAQTVAKRQMEQKRKNVLNRRKLNTEKLPKTNITSSKKADNKREGNDWLSTWSRGHGVDSHDRPAVDQQTDRKNLPRVNRIKVVDNQSNAVSPSTGAQSDMEVLKTLFGNGTNLTVPNVV